MSGSARHGERLSSRPPANSPSSRAGTRSPPAGSPSASSTASPSSTATSAASARSSAPSPSRAAAELAAARAGDRRCRTPCARGSPPSPAPTSTSPHATRRSTTPCSSSTAAWRSRRGHPEPLKDAFAALRAPVIASAHLAEHDADLQTELLWSTLHGLATLQAAARIPAEGQPRADRPPPALARPWIVADRGDLVSSAGNPLRISAIQACSARRWSEPRTGVLGRTSDAADVRLGRRDTWRISGGDAQVQWGEAVLGQRGPELRQRDRADAVHRRELLPPGPRPPPRAS